MTLWTQWWAWVLPLRKACSRQRTFLWMLSVLAAFCVREDLWGVTSMVRALGIQAACYGPLLDFFHSTALDVEHLTRLWAALVINTHPGLVRCNNRIVLLGDGLKVGKAGKKMPGVKRLFQSSESNTKPQYILGHSCQAVAVLVSGLASVAAIPLAARIHEGVVFSNRDKRTLLDKMNALLASLGLTIPAYFVADAYYASRKTVRALLQRGDHLVTRLRMNAVAYYPAKQPEVRRRGRPKTYGGKVALKSLFAAPEKMTEIPSPVYGEQDVQLCVRSLDLLWRPVGHLVRFVAVQHPARGRILLMTTDLALEPADVIRLYGYRFKIEVAFKAALRTVGAFLYHFWMRPMDPIKRAGKNQYLHKKTEAYRAAVRRKLAAYHRFIQLGLIAQGLLLVLSTTVPDAVWSHFGSWLRTIRPNLCPSEAVVAMALRNTLPHFLAGDATDPAFAKFLTERLDPETTGAAPILPLGARVHAVRCRCSICFHAASQRFDFTQVLKSRIRWPPIRDQRIPLRPNRVLTKVLQAASTGPLPMGSPCPRSSP